MSSTWVAEFDNEEDYNHFVARFKEIAPDGGNIIVPELPENPEDARKRGAWVDLEETIFDFPENFDYDGDEDPPLKDPCWAVSFDIAIWDDWTKDFIHCIFAEMCHRYKFVEIGCNTGDLVSQEKFLKGGIFRRQRYEMEWLKTDFHESPENYKDDDISDEKIDQALQEFDETEVKFREAAKRLFDGDASDMILTFEEEEV